MEDSGCGLVNRVVTSETRQPQFESSHRSLLFPINCIEKTISLFSSFSHHKIQKYLNWQNRRWCAWDSNLGHRMVVGADVSTDLWMPPTSYIVDLIRISTLWHGPKCLLILFLLLILNLTTLADNNYEHSDLNKTF